MSPRVLLLRGHQATPWGMRPWEELPARFDVRALVTKSNRFDVESLRLARERVRALRDLLPRGTAGDLVALGAGDRYIGLEDHLEGVDVVHAEDISYWSSAEAARHRERFGYRLVLTVWETIPMLAAYRNRHARRYREQTLASTDLFLAATERARDALLLEGAAPERVEVCPPGIDLERFERGQSAPPPGRHLIISPGRLAWEKGHQDVLRALAVLRRSGEDRGARLLIVGAGPEETRLREHADELGIGDAVEIRGGVPYDEMPALYAQASCMVLASLASAGCMVLTGPPHCFWEEQFGLVLAEALAAGLPVVASTSGAIPEVLRGAATHFAPGDWAGLARALAAGPLARPAGERAAHPRELVELYSTKAAAGRLAAAYDRLLGGG
jgi:glycosyltransferase involved in cell wall biosynthesis